MRLIKEYIFKEIILFFLVLIAIETAIIIILSKSSKKIYDVTYKETLEKIKNKSIEAVQKYEEYAKNYLSKYLTDLKIISLHSILFNINRTDDNNNNLNNENKKIYIATLEELNKIEDLRKYQSNEGNLYVNKYGKEFENFTDTNKILNNLFNNHSELDSIGYYNPDSLNEIDLYEYEKKAIKNIMSIFKSIYIKRYLIKRKNTDYIRLFIVNQNKIFIYPPTAYNLTQTYFFNNINREANCINVTFPKCFYDYAISLSREYNHIMFINEKMNHQISYGSACLRMRYLKNQTEDSIICEEIEYLKIFQPLLYFNQIDKYEFGIFIHQNDNIYPIINSDEKSYDLITKHYNITNNTLHTLISDGYSKLFTFFLFFYYNFSECLEIHPELQVDWKLIDEEYEEAISKIRTKLKNFNYSKGNNNNYIEVDFNKTICRKKLLKKEYEIVKDQFKMLIYPVFLEVKALDNNYIEVSNITIKNLLSFYIYSIVSTNPKLNEEKLKTIINIKMKRTVTLFFLMSFSVLSLFIIFISFISQISLNPIYELLNQLKNLEIRRGNIKDYILDEDKIKAPNKEIVELKDIYDFMRKILIIKNAFEEENYLKKHNLEFYNLIRDINIFRFLSF